MAASLVLHVLPLDIPRGAQRYARAMRQALDGQGAEHRLLTLFDSPYHEMQADIELGIERGRTANWGLDVGALRALRRALQQLQPACVVAHGSQPLKYLALSAPRQLPVIAYRLGIAHVAAHRPAQRAFHALLYRRALRVAGVSDECLEEAQRLFFVPKPRLVLIPNGRDPERFRPAAARTTGLPTLLFVGNVSASKRPDWFLDVVAALRERRTEFRAQLVGDGPLLSALTPRARQLEVDVLGNRADVPELLRNADVLAFTSIPDGEGMPGVFIEAGMSGLPVVSTAVPGARTVLDDGRTGFVVGVNDREQFVSRVAQLLENAELRASMGRDARERCASEFSIERSVRRWQVLLRDLLTSTAPLGTGGVLA